MPDWVVHAVSSGIALAASVIALYVSYRQAILKEWFRKEMTSIVASNCASKEKFEAHVKSDEVFQQTIIDNWEKTEKMGDSLLEAKFETVKTQVANVGSRVDHLTLLVEQRLRFRQHGE